MKVHQQCVPCNPDQTLRKQIQAIQNDKNKNVSEKARLVQGLMNNGTRIISQKQAPIEHNCATGCSHYKKECSQFFFSCCQVIDPCHRCHIARGKCNIRPAQVESIVCNSCSTRQAPSKSCISCFQEFSQKYCKICKIWTALDITHCEHCGFCRVGKADEVFHCHTCQACFGTEGRDQHRCAKVQLKDTCCPLCLESVHTAQKPSNILPCGHVLHGDCWREAARKGEFRCPTCRKSLFNMQQYWENIRRAIQMQPLPPNYFPIRVGDIVESPHGSFLVLAKRVEPGDNIHGPPTKTFYEGHLQPAEDAYQSQQQDMPSPSSVVTYGDSIDEMIDTMMDAVDDADVTDVDHTHHIPVEVIQAPQAPTVAIYAEEYLIKRKIVRIVCYDCEQKTEVGFHPLGLECQACRGFNTSQL
jgi:RING finger/CHY zinc finger protein 1